MGKTLLYSQLPSKGFILIGNNGQAVGVYEFDKKAKGSNGRAQEVGVVSHLKAEWPEFTPEWKTCALRAEVKSIRRIFLTKEEATAAGVHLIMAAGALNAIAREFQQQMTAILDGKNADEDHINRLRALAKANIGVLKEGRSDFTISAETEFVEAITPALEKYLTAMSLTF